MVDLHADLLRKERRRRRRVFGAVAAMVALLAAGLAGTGALNGFRNDDADALAATMRPAQSAAAFAGIASAALPGMSLAEFFAATSALRFAQMRPANLHLKGEKGTPPPAAFAAIVPPLPEEVAAPPAEEAAVPPAAFAGISPLGLPPSVPTESSGGIPGVIPTNNPGLPGPVGPIRPTPSNPPASVPEPASWALMILGMGGIAFAMRCRSRQSLLKVAKTV